MLPTLLHAREAVGREMEWRGKRQDVFGWGRGDKLKDSNWKVISVDWMSVKALKVCSISKGKIVVMSLFIRLCSMSLSRKDYSSLWWVGRKRWRTFSVIRKTWVVSSYLYSLCQVAYFLWTLFWTLLCILTYLILRTTLWQKKTNPSVFYRLSFSFGIMADSWL